MKNLTIVLAFLLIALISCQKTTIEPNETEQPTQQIEEQETGSTNLLLGKWSFTQFEEGVFTYERVDQFADDRIGLAFDTASKMIHWNYGRCATPPAHFYEIEGIYKQNDNILSVDGWIEGAYKILECTETSLILEELD